ncbi:MAG: hypothetical protein KAX72_04580 [Chitinophagales bacterium]|nr:hypothetical protein [Bacteroidota bacterium]MBP8249355.1 hypothetical protein [Chitinophagales bacterium]MBP9880895.1 hypothetical protein [Chitinophagales bacterium]
MPDFKFISRTIITGFVIMSFTSTFVACKKNIVEEVIYDNIIYQVDTVPVYQNNSEKDRLKTPLQYISSLYSNLYYSSIPSNILDNLVIYRLSIGDKTLVNEMILNAMLKDPVVTAHIPENYEMRNDVDAFVEECYLRFYLRLPTEYEKYGLVNIIEADDEIDVVDVYRSFLLSNEYMFY